MKVLVGVEVAVFLGVGVGVALVQANPGGVKRPLGKSAQSL